MKSFEFLGEIYGTQKQFLDYVNYRLSSINGRVAGNEHDFLCALYQRHPYFNPNIDYFHVVQLQRGGQDVSRVFDGEHHLFSKHACVSQKVMSDAARTKSLARASVVPQILSARRSLGTCCVLCQATSDLQVDHHPRLFKDLLTDFGTLSIRGMKLVEERDWYEYHKAHATYRLLCGPCNRKTYHLK